MIAYRLLNAQTQPEFQEVPEPHAAPGQVLVKNRVNAIALASAEDIRRDSDLFLEGVSAPEYQRRMQAAMKRGFQTRDAEMNLGQLVADL